MTIAVEHSGELNRMIDALALEPALAHLPKPARLALARKRYGWIDYRSRTAISWEIWAEQVVAQTRQAILPQSVAHSA